MPRQRRNIIHRIRNREMTGQHRTIYTWVIKGPNGRILRSGTTSNRIWVRRMALDTRFNPGGNRFSYTQVLM